MRVALPVLVMAALSSSPASAGDAKQTGEALYEEACASCHLPDGSGVDGLQPAIHRGNAIVVGDRARLIRLLLRGPEAALPKDRQRYSNEMPTFESLADGEIAAVLTYVRTAFGNKAASVTSAQVAAERARP